MYYCEACRMLSEDAECAVCRTEDLREVKPQDLCFFSEAGIMYAQMLEGYLADQDIPCLLVPVSKGSRAAVGLSFSTYKIYLPYQNFEEVRAIAAILNPDPTENLRKNLTENRHAWHGGKWIIPEIRSWPADRKAAERPPCPDTDPGRA